MENYAVVRFSRDTSLARIDSRSYGDETELPDYSNTFCLLSIVCVLLSIVTYILDISLVVWLLYVYSIGGLGGHFAVTLTFYLLSAIVTTAVSLRWYIIDHEDPSLGRTTPMIHWIIRIVFLLLQLAPLLRYIDTLHYGLKSRKCNCHENLPQPQKKSLNYRRQMLDEDTNAALLRLFHCFLHSAPQAIIQLVIVVKSYTNSSRQTEVKTQFGDCCIQIGTILMSLVSIGWSLAAYHRSIRCARDDKINLEWRAIFMVFSWQFFSGLSRVLALSLLAALFPIWMGVICALHWMMMTICVVLNQHQEEEQHMQQQSPNLTADNSCNRCEELLLATALGLAYIVAFLSPRDGTTRYIYLAYYLVYFMENTGALVVWCVTINSSNVPVLYYGAVVVQVLTFLLALICMFAYYNYWHPSMCGERHKSVARAAATVPLSLSDVCRTAVDAPTEAKSTALSKTAFTARL